MNKQDKGNGKRGIEWTNYTWNPIGGCKHQCRWQMPDGTIAVCYAETVAERVAGAAYNQGFSHHYWRPDVLSEPLNLKAPSKIFLDSMSDLMGHWVPDEQIEQVLDVCRRAHWHTFQLLTKNPPRLNRFDFPPNVWAGVSAPPSFMMGKAITPFQQDIWFYTAVRALARCNAKLKWVSFEPLSFDIADGMSRDGWDWLVDQLGWAVIGAASNGPKVYQPEPKWVSDLVDLLDCRGIPIFYKGNLYGNPGIAEWREEFPEVKVVTQGQLF